MKTQILLNLKSLRRGLWGGTGLVLLLSFFLLSSCTVNPQITMTTVNNDTISIEIVGLGTATINWGDGSMQTGTLMPDSDQYYSHEYLTLGTYTITITGDYISDLDCSDNDLTSLDVSNNTALRRLNCSDNQLTSLDVSNIIMLIGLNCYNNRLTSLDVSKNTALTYLDCGANPLMALDVSKNTKLTDLGCGGNQLTSLDVSSNTALTHLGCQSNELTVLDVSSNTALVELNCSNNQLTTTALNALFGTLHGNTIANKKKIFIIENNPGTDSCYPGIATDKGWLLLLRIGKTYTLYTTINKLD